MTQNLPEHLKFSKLVGLQTKVNTCKFKDFVLKIKATRLSGERNTSLGNGLVNLLIFKYFSYINNWKNSECVVEGDDLLGVFNGKYPTEAEYKKLGFTVKIEKPTHLNEASFCGQIFDTITYTTITDPVKVILKTPWISSKYVNSKTKKKLELLKGKAMSGLSDYPDCPIITDYLQMIYRLSGDHYLIDNTLNNYNKSKFKSILKTDFMKKPNITIQSRELVEKLYKIPTNIQILMEGFFISVNKFSDIMIIPYLDMFVSQTQIRFFHTFYSNVNDAIIMPLLPQKSVHHIINFDARRNVKNGECTKEKTKISNG